MILQPKNTIGLSAAIALVGAALWGSMMALTPPMSTGTVEIKQLTPVQTWTVEVEQIDSDPRAQASAQR